MSVKNDYDRFIAEQKEVMKKELIQFAMLDQEKRYVEPFRIFGNVYYAGDSWVCVHVTIREWSSAHRFRKCTGNGHADSFDLVSWL